MDMAEGGVGCVGRMLDAGGIGNVAGNALHIRPEIAQASNGGRQRVHLDIGQHHLHARLRKGPAERQPDAARAARHECRLAGKLPHDSSLRFPSSRPRAAGPSGETVSTISRLSSRQGLPLRASRSGRDDGVCHQIASILASIDDAPRSPAPSMPVRKYYSARRRHFPLDAPEQCCGVCLPAFTTRGSASWAPLSLSLHTPSRRPEFQPPAFCRPRQWPKWVALTALTALTGFPQFPHLRPGQSTEPAPSSR